MIIASKIRLLKLQKDKNYLIFQRRKVTKYGVDIEIVVYDKVLECLVKNSNCTQIIVVLAY